MSAMTQKRDFAVIFESAREKFIGAANVSGARLNYLASDLSSAIVHVRENKYKKMRNKNVGFRKKRENTFGLGRNVTKNKLKGGI